MKIACLQFAPKVGDVDNNLNRADAILNGANIENLDLLVLPELAFTGYNFRSLHHISRYLEHTTSGITLLWARATALKHECVVTVGYPEKVDVRDKWPASPEYYNSAITVNADGETIANYRKKYLYFRDKTWALEGPDGFFDGQIPGLGNVAIGICKWSTLDLKSMDLNPYKSKAPSTAFEFSYHVLHKQANLAIISMAWTTHQDLSLHSRKSKQPDMDTLSCWVAMLEPLIRAKDEGEIIVVLANRCGTEGETTYAGTSCVLGIEDGEVKVYGILGREERELLIVDTEQPPQFKIVAEQNEVMPDDILQSCHAPTLDPDQVAARESIVQGREIDEDTKGLLGNINNVWAERTSISLAEPLFQHLFFAGEQKKLQTTPVSDCDMDKEDHPPDSASSMKVNTPWEFSPSLFRAEDITKIMKGPRSYE